MHHRQYTEMKFRIVENLIVSLIYKSNKLKNKLSILNADCKWIFSVKKKYSDDSFSAACLEKQTAMSGICT